MSDLAHRLYARLPVTLRSRVHDLRGPRSPFTEGVLGRGAIFVHVPKAAGTSVKREVYGRNTGGHRSIAEFAAADPERTRDFVKFSFVRNPWDRLLACYSYLSQADGTTAHSRRFAARVLSATPDFESFVVALTRPDFRELVLTKPHFKPQLHWICMPGERTHAMDVLGRFETLAADLDTVLARIGPRPGAARETEPGTSAPVVHTRPSRHLPYREAYTDRTRDIVADFYADDVEVLGYSF